MGITIIITISETASQMTRTMGLRPSFTMTMTISVSVSASVSVSVGASVSVSQ